MLHELLDANLRYRPEYQGHLSNHLPMALHALHCLGAGPQRLQAFYDGYAKRLQRAAVPDTHHAPTLDSDWLALRGLANAYPALQAHFNAWITRNGVPQTLGLAVPALLSDVSAALFHGLIRTTHALQAGHAGELAAGLAYWASRWQPLPPPSVVDSQIPFAHWAAQLRAQAPAWRATESSISRGMREATQSRLYQDGAGALAPAPSVRVRVAELAVLAIRSYVASPNFTLLHLITGLHALRTLLPWMEDSVDTQAVLAQHFFAAYLAAQVLPAAEPQVQAIATWPELIAVAMASDDEHVIKLVYACREEARAYSDGRYLHAASRRVFG